MPQISSFRGLRFNPARVGDLALAMCPPYDVISSADQERLIHGSPYNIVRVESGQSLGGDTAEHNRYTRAAELLHSWIAEDALSLENRPALYWLEHTFLWAGQCHTRRGVFAAVRLHPWSDRAVLPHETTFSGPKEDRYQLLDATKVNVSPVFMLHRFQGEALNQAVSQAQQATPVLDVTDGAERQTLWRIIDPAAIRDIQAEYASQTFYIADGHHRYETALRYQDTMLGDQSVPEDHPARFVLSYLVAMNDPGLVVLPTHRVVRTVEVGRIRAHIDAYGDAFSRESVSLSGEASELDRIVERLTAMSLSAPAFALVAHDAAEVEIIQLQRPDALAAALPHAPQALRDLDVTLLHSLVLNPLFPSDHDRESSISYVRDASDAVRAVKTGKCSAAFLLGAPSVLAMATVADSGARMPEKSTYFYPKVTTGLVMRSVAE
jgi:uncharacterized protein (DUF1015 family)